MQKTKRSEKGNAMVELALVAPILFFLVLAAFDFGIYAYSFISVENAARVGAARNSSGMDSAADRQTACTMAISELRGLPNIGASFQSDCSSSPIVVSSVLCSHASPCPGSASSADGASAAAITVSYSLPSVFRVPLTGPAVFTRTSQMKIRSNQ
jgi:Flp pilus assembly protein TadG